VALSNFFACGVELKAPTTVIQEEEILRKKDLRRGHVAKTSQFICFELYQLMTNAIAIAPDEDVDD